MEQQQRQQPKRLRRSASAASAAPDRVILVDEQDRPLGDEAKLRAHENGGKLHRAFSVFIFNGEGQMLLQRRSPGKYHFGGLWTNACCSHPRPGQDVLGAARQRLREELGFDTDLTEGFSFVYRAHDARTGLTEHEFDHVLFGQFDGEPQPNPDEVDGWKWMDPEQIRADLEQRPDAYTPWFRIALARAIAHRRA